MRIWKWLLGPWLALVIIAAFTYAREARNFVPGASRIIFFHVPQAELATVAFLASMIYAARYLRRHQAIDDIKSATSAELGFLCCILTTITGSLFARVQWGSFWNWDPRETSIVVLLLIYGAYFALRASIDDPERRAQLAATYTIFAFVTVPFLIFVIPRIPALNSLHPSDTLTTKEGLSNDIRVVLYSSLLGFAGVYAWLFNLAVRVRVLQAAQQGERAPAPVSTVVKVRN